MGVPTIELMQWIGAIGIGLFYPIQNWRVFMTRKPIGLSFLGFSFIAVGVAGYLALGVRLATPIFYVLNISNLIFVTMLLLAMWFWSPSLKSWERVLGLLVLFVGLSGLAAVNLFAASIATTTSGWIGLIGIVAFYPIQNTKLFLTRNPTGLSFVAFFSLFVGLCGLTAFGFLVDDITIILGNGFTALGTLPILWGIVHWKKQPSN